MDKNNTWIVFWPYSHEKIHDTNRQKEILGNIAEIKLELGRTNGVESFSEMGSVTVRMERYVRVCAAGNSRTCHALIKF